ncbi:M48 family metallopeptidase [Candidatus Methylocalor cossyra]|uniref:YgjP-like metallopeptidase domain-containing protein n=1 Tax=Candidatus Methylocalor cossyra TaxID=3108543 RepID=A0ABP1C827_9GAMM
MPHDFPLPYGIRYSRRATRLRLIVKASGVELVVPSALGEERALEFLQRHRAWAERKMVELQGRLPTHAGLPQRLETGATLPFQGREVPLVVQGARDRRARVEFDGRFLITVPVTDPAQTEWRVRMALFGWVKVWLAGEAAQLAAQHAGKFGLQPREIRVKRMRSRWGSCGPGNDVNLNWLLAFTPPGVLEYVMVHELCHIRHRDHSARFWDLVARHLPGYLEQRQWLQRHGAELLRRLA